MPPERRPKSGKCQGGKEALRYVYTCCAAAPAPIPAKPAAKKPAAAAPGPAMAPKKPAAAALGPAAKPAAKPAASAPRPGSCQACSQAGRRGARLRMRAHGWLSAHGVMDEHSFWQSARPQNMRGVSEAIDAPHPLAPLPGFLSKGRPHWLGHFPLHCFSFMSAGSLTPATDSVPQHIAATVRSDKPYCNLRLGLKYQHKCAVDSHDGPLLG